MKKHSVIPLISIATSVLFELTTAYRSPAHHIHPHSDYDYRGFHPSRQGSGHFASLNRSLVPWEAFLPPLKDTTTLNSEATTCSNTNDNKPGSFWLPNVPHQGTSPFLSDSSEYIVYRNVKDFGAKGDGSTDDSAAFNAAITRTSSPCTLLAYCWMTDV